MIEGHFIGPHSLVRTGKLQYTSRLGPWQDRVLHASPWVNVAGVWFFFRDSLYLSGIPA